MSAPHSFRAGDGEAFRRLNDAAEPVLIVTGSPGVGKSTVARALDVAYAVLREPLAVCIA